MGFPKGPSIHIVYTLALKYLYRDYIKAKVFTSWVHGPSGFISSSRKVQHRCCRVRVGFMCRASGVDVEVWGLNLKDEMNPKRVLGFKA